MITLIVDWGKKEVRARPGSGKRETWYECTCPSCASKYWLRAHDARKGRMCKLCQKSAAGKASYQKLHDNPLRQQKIRNQLARSISRDEKLVKMWIEELGFGYEQQYRVTLPDGRLYFVDFAVGETLIEVRGYWHLRERIGKDSALIDCWQHGPTLFIDNPAKNPIQARRELENVLLQ